MDATPCVSSVPSLTDKQIALLSILDGCLAQHGLSVRVNPEEAFFFRGTSPIVVDIEHDEHGEVVGIGVSRGVEVAYFTEITNRLKERLVSCPLICHNGRSDLECLRQWGIPVRDEQLVWDTELMAHISDSSLRKYGLKALAKAQLGVEYPSYEDIVGKRTKKQKAPRVTLDQQPVELVAKYNAMDCFATGKLYDIQQSVSSIVREYHDTIEKPVSFIFQKMENRGVRIDLGYLATVLKPDLESQISAASRPVLDELGPINLDSPPQLLKALHAKGLRPMLKKKPSTAKPALAQYSDLPIVQGLLKYSELSTLLHSFVYPYLERDQEVVHPFFNQCGTRTGRPACSNPNLLQIPKHGENAAKVRRMFIPRDGMTFGDCDYGQIEPRAMAHMSRDTALCAMFNAGVDFHTFTAEKLGIDRRKAKVLNLSVGYRATYKSVSGQLQCSDQEAQAQIDAWWGLFPVLRRWQDKLIFDAKRSGFVTTLYGRRIKIDGLDEYNTWKREAAERQLVNNVAQASATEVMKFGMIRVNQDKRFSPRFGLLVQVYDALLAESPEMAQDIQYMKEDMENACHLDVPLTVDARIGANWADVEKV